MKKMKNRRIQYLFLCMLLLTVVLVSAGCKKKVTDEQKDDNKRPQTAVEEQLPEEEQTKTDTEDETTADVQNNDETTPEVREEPQSVVSEQRPEGVEFPMKLDKERLEVSSAFEYSGINPDCENAYSESIGAIQLQNISGEYLKWAEIAVTLEDGSQLEFVAEDIPAGAIVFAYELQNKGYDGSQKITEVKAETFYEESADKEAISYSVEGIDITVENVSGENLDNVTLNYHCTIDGIYFGGKSYKVTLDELKTGESKVVSATECYLGDVAVANVVYE